MTVMIMFTIDKVRGKVVVVGDDDDHYVEDDKYHFWCWWDDDNTADDDDDNDRFILFNFIVRSPKVKAAATKLRPLLPRWPIPMPYSDDDASDDDNNKDFTTS